MRRGAPRVRGGRKRVVFQSLLEDERIRDWHKSMALRSERTAYGTVYRVGRIAKFLGTTPAGVLELGEKEPRKLGSLLVDYVRDGMDRKLNQAGVAGNISALRLWFKSQHVAFDGFPRVADYGKETVIGERVPTIEELQRIVDAIPTARGKVVALFMSQSGLRPGTLGTYCQGEALRLKNLPELDIEKLEFRKLPFVIEVPGRISKNRTPYITFGSKILADRLVEYLRQRRGTQIVYRPAKDRKRFVPTKLPGEKLTADSPLVTGEMYDMLGSFVSEKAIMVELTQAIRRAKPDDVQWVPYVLRSFASTRLWEASMDGAIDFQTREAILGHDAGISALYSSRRKLEASTVEKMRTAYDRCARFLWPAAGKEAKQDEQRAWMALTLRLEEVNTWLKSLSAEEREELSRHPFEEILQRLDERKSHGSAAQVAAGPSHGGLPPNGGNGHHLPQRIVSVTEAEALVNEGWIADFAVGDRVVMKQGS